MLHIGKNNSCYDYTIKNGGSDIKLDTTEAEKDLGITIDPSLSFDRHINDCVKKANKIVGLLLRTLVYKDKVIMVPLFKSLVRPIVEYGNSIWSPYLRKHIDCIEKIQRNFTRKIYGMNGIDYSDRLRLLNLHSLEFRRVRGDLIETYKILHGIYDTNTTACLFNLSNSDFTRGHNLKLNKPFCNTRKFHQFFTNRTISLWNSLPSDIVNAVSINSFKNRIDIYFSDLKYTTHLDVYH